MDDTLFALPPTEPPESEILPPGVPRLQRPNRGELELRSVDLDGLLPADHRTRLVWAFTEGLDLAPLYERIRAVEGHPGRPPIDPAILTALWLDATLEESAAPGRSIGCATSTTPTAGLPVGSG